MIILLTLEADETLIKAKKQKPKKPKKG